MKKKTRLKKKIEYDKLVVFKNNQCTNNHNRTVGEEENLIDKSAHEQPLVIDTSPVSFFLYSISDLFDMIVNVLE